MQYKNEACVPFLDAQGKTIESAIKPLCSNNSYAFKVEIGGERLDKFLASRVDCTRSQLKHAKILLNGAEVKSGTILRVGDIIDVEFKREAVTGAEPENIAIDVVFEDEYLLVVNKPRGMVVHPGAGIKSGTLLNGLLGRAAKNAIMAETARGEKNEMMVQVACAAKSETMAGTGSANKSDEAGSGCAAKSETLTRTGCTKKFDAAETGREAELERAGIVHRLDKNTAGLMVVAKTVEMQAKLATCFEKHEVERIYVGIVEGVLMGDGKIDKNIVRDPNRRTLYKAVAEGGRKAVTHFKVLKNFPKWTLVQFKLETGRTHQIRVHCKSIGHPIVGDPEYNPNSSVKGLSGQMLESVEISFLHPATGKQMRFKINPTSEFGKTVDRLAI